MPEEIVIAPKKAIIDWKRSGFILLGLAPEVICFASLATAGLPFNLLIGAAPNAIASASINNIPFTATMLPIIAFLNQINLVGLA